MLVDGDSVMSKDAAAQAMHTEAWWGWEASGIAWMVFFHVGLRHTEAVL